MAQDNPHSRDTEHLLRAVVVGDTARLRSAPNPWVGCVLVSPSGDVVGEGASAAAGGPHAEVEALRIAGDRAHGATAYVTLEPCSHHGRTPPCADALIAAGVARVVVALEDPDPRVSGAGIAKLVAAGIDVVVLDPADAARDSLAPYLHHRRTGKAFVHAKLAMSLDARVAPGDGSPVWLTGPGARVDAHRLRARSQAIVVGSETALVDHPTLTVRDTEAPPTPPIRVLLDSRGRVPADGALFDTSVAPTLVCTTRRAPASSLRACEDAGADVLVVPAGAGGVDLDAVLAELGTRGVVQAMFEGGPTVIASLVASDLVDRLTVYMAPVVLGDKAPAAFGDFVANELRESPRFRVTSTLALDGDVRMDMERTADSEGRP